MTKKLLRHPVVKNAISLLTVQIAKYILPLVTIPYLARILGPQEWGLVIFAQVSAQWFEMILDYGFNLSATCEISRNRDNQQQVTEIVSGVMGASGLLLVVSTLIVLSMSILVPAFKLHPDYLIWAWLIGVAQGLNPLWYFQAIERMQFQAMLDLGTRVIATVITLMWVKTSNEGWKVLAVQATAGLLAYASMLVLMYRDIPWQLPRIASALKALRMGGSMFLYRCSVSLYTTANTFILGLLAPLQQIAFYGESQRLTRAVGTLSSPITQAIFPRISYLLTNNSKRAAKLASISMLVMGLGSLSLAAMLAIFAPLIVNTLFGAKFEPAVPLLRILVFVLPFMSLNYVLGLQWMLPLGLNRAFNSITITAGLINLILAPIFTLKFGTIGMAWMVVFSDAFVTIGIYIILWRKGLTIHHVWNTPLI